MDHSRVDGRDRPADELQPYEGKADPALENGAPARTTDGTFAEKP